MSELENTGEISITQAELALKWALYASEGRYNAFLFAWDHRNNLSQIEAEIQEQRNLLSSLQTGPMAHGTGPRLYKDTYVSALQEALNILQKGQALQS